MMTAFIGHSIQSETISLKFNFLPFNPNVRIPSAIYPILKLLVTKKFHFFVGFPPSVQDFLVKKHLPLNARVSGYFDLKLHNLSPFGLKIREIHRKYAKRGQIVTREFKGTCYLTKNSCTDWGNHTKK